MRGELYSEQGKRKSNLPSLFLLYFSYSSLFNFSLLSIFLCNLVIIIRVNQISYKRNGVGDCMHNISPSNFIRNTPIHTSHISHFITFLYYMQFFLVHVHLYICAQFLIQYFPIMFSAIMLIFVGRRF